MLKRGNAPIKGPHLECKGNADDDHEPCSQDLPPSNASQLKGELAHQASSQPSKRSKETCGPYSVPYGTLYAFIRPEKLMFFESITRPSIGQHTSDDTGY